MLYQPHVGEFRSLLEHATHKWPELATRIQSAEQILFNGNLAWKENSWCVESQNDSAIFYRVTATC